MAVVHSDGLECCAARTEQPLVAVGALACQLGQLGRDWAVELLKAAGGLAGTQPEVISAI